MGARKDWHQVGTSYGLTLPCSNDEPEQIYVFVDKDAPASDHPDYPGSTRPVIIEGHKGYSIPHRMFLSRRQASDLAKLLIEALAVEA